MYVMNPVPNDCTSQLPGPEAPTVRSQTSAGRCRSRQEVAVGLPVRSGPAALLPAHTPTVLRFLDSRALRDQRSLAAPPRDPHPGGAEAAANARLGRSGGDVAPRGRSNDVICPPETACTQCLRSARQKVPFC